MLPYRFSERKMTPSQAIDLAAAIVGSKQTLCKKLGVHRQAVSNWTKSQVPLKRAVQIEQLTNGRVTIGMLRPEYA